MEKAADDQRLSRKQLFLILISTFGMKETHIAWGWFARALGMDDLFEKK